MKSFRINDALRVQQDFDKSAYALAIHTSSPDLGLAISNFAGDSRYQVWDLGRDLSTQLHVHLAEFLKPQTWADLAFLAVAKGPGGFTGTRIGVVTARTLAQQLEVPLFAISSLEAIAWSARSELPEERAIAVQMQAQRGEVFGAIYQLTPDGLGLDARLPDTVLSPAEWKNKLEEQPTPCHQVEADGGLGHTVAAVLSLAESHWKSGKRPHWSEALPFYGQHPVDQG